MKNTGEAVVLRSKDSDEDSLVFDPAIGAAGDGNSLQKQISADGILSWIAATPTPGRAVAVSNTPTAASTPTQSTQPVAVAAATSSSAVTPSTPVTLEPPTTPVTTSVARTIPVEPQIFCKINAKSEAFAGVETAFSAQGLGLKKQPLQNARYIWNFGDGQTKEGQYVLHTYTQPGVYDVFLETASDVYSASDRLKVTVRLPQLTMTHSDSVLIISNQDALSTDLFGLKIHQAGSADFLFPEHSMLSARGEMNIDAGLFATTHADVLRASEFPITLQYLNGRVMATSSEREAQSELTTPSVPAAAKTSVSKGKAVHVAKATKPIAKPRPATDAAKTIVFASTSDQVIVLNATAKERRLNYYGATAGVLVLLTFAWWYLLR